MNVAKTVWLAVDKDGTETVHRIRPIRMRMTDRWVSSRCKVLSPGTIKMLIGGSINWSYAPVEYEWPEDPKDLKFYI